MQTENRGNLFIVAAPSGGGKTSLVKKVVASLDGIDISVSHTTRAMRPRERDGVDYFFVTEDSFQKLIAQQAFLEYAKVFDHYYGTSLAQINDRLSAGIDVVLDIDWQGARQIKQLLPQALTIFIMPPSFSALKQRLVERGQDDAAVIATRMRQARDELLHYDEFDYLVVNDHFDKAVSELKAIIVAARLKFERQSVQLSGLLSFLLEEVL